MSASQHAVALIDIAITALKAAEAALRPLRPTGELRLSIEETDTGERHGYVCEAIELLERAL